MGTPAFRRVTFDEVRRTWEGKNLDRDQLLNILANFVVTYIHEGTMPFSLTGTERDKTAGDQERQEQFTFPKLIDQLKKRLKLAELRGFAVEDGKVTLTIENQKVSWDEEGRATTSFLPVRQRAGAAAPQAAAAGAAGPAAPKAPDKPAAPAKGEEKKVSLSDVESRAVADIVERFRNIDLD